MKLELAKSAGFCYGVKRAVRLAEEAAAAGEPCVMLGPIIHNESEIKRLKALGVGLVESALAHFSRNEAVAADGGSLFNQVLRCARTPTDASDFSLLRSQDKRFAV